MSQNSVVIALSRPVVAHGEMLSSLTFEEPTGRHLLDAGSPKDPAWEQRVCAHCCGVPPSVVHAMPMLDVLSLLTQLNDFLGDQIVQEGSSTTSSTVDTGGTTQTTSSG